MSDLSNLVLATKMKLEGTRVEEAWDAKEDPGRVWDAKEDPGSVSIRVQHRKARF